ncbi:MAG: serine/threonine protein kinase [Planctomycetes bacterium]|nr:serine/threonine protein kinase [Planctomycetota bacterium]
MKISRIISTILRAIPSGTLAGDAEEARRFLRERLAFYAKVLFLVGTLALVLRTISQIALGNDRPSRILLGPAQWIALATCLCLLAVWRICERRRATVATLFALDAAAAIAACSGTAIATSLADPGLTMEGHALVVSTTVLLFRALVVPSSPRRTFTLSAAALLPMMVASWILPSEEAAEAAGPTASLRAALLVQWGIAMIAIATIASSVIHRLREKVREARRLGPYTIEEKLGEGAMGEVYRARHALLRRPTAIKLLRPERASEACIARFEREVQATSRLSHPNTVAIYDYGRTPDGVFYCAMELLPGVTLKTLIEDEGAVAETRAIHILRQTAASLAEAHGEGLVHRDIKPANIMLCERGGSFDVVKVLDFGLVRDLGEAADAIGMAPGTIAGTPETLSPEAIRTPEAIDGRSDIYALGIVGYTLVAGRGPFDAESAAEIMRHHIETPPPPPSVRLGRPVAPDLEAVILSCLEKNPSRRPPDARRLIETLDACRDAGRWTQEEARRWWSRRSNRGEVRKTGERPRVDPGARTAIAEVDVRADRPRTPA